MRSGQSQQRRVTGHFNAFYLPSDSAQGGQRFCLHHLAQGGVERGAVLCVPPLAEEMNKSRRMMALQARAMAEAGFEVMQMDLFGCGDSTGEFEDATWEAWIADVQLGMRWLDSTVKAPLWIWGLRGGALLACDAMRGAGSTAARLLLWQPVTNGNAALQQFLRLRTARQALAGGAHGTGSPRQQLDREGFLDVAGYRLSSALASGWAAASLQPPAVASDALWFEVRPNATQGVAPALAAQAQTWRDAGWRVSLSGIDGPAFWQTTEIECVPELIHASVAGMLNIGATE